MDDSGNSGSFQSSTGEWDEEFDSHANAISALINNNNSPLYNPQQPPPPPPPPLQPYNHRFPNYFDHSMSLQNYPRSHMKPDVLDYWSKNLKSKNNSTYHINPMLPSLFATQQNQPPLLPLPVAENTTDTPPQTQTTTTQVARNPRKRPRASRGAATTVLTTDTANFRAMVQEFTGIQRSRLNIVSTGSNPPTYHTRPFPQKVELTSSSSSSSSSILNTKMNLGENINALNCSLNNYQFTPQTTSSLFNNIPNPFVASLHDPNAVSSALLGTKSQAQDFSSNDDFGGQINRNCRIINGLPGLNSSDQTTSRNNINEAVVSWGNEVGSSQESR